MDALTTLHARREVEREQCGNTAVLAHQLQALLDELKPDRRSRLGVRRVEDREHWAREQPREVRMHVGVEEVCVLTSDDVRRSSMAPSSDPVSEFLEALGVELVGGHRAGPEDHDLVDDRAPSSRWLQDGPPTIALWDVGQ